MTASMLQCKIQSYLIVVINPLFIFLMQYHTVLYMVCRGDRDGKACAMVERRAARKLMTCSWQAQTEQST